jgi:hypothetical protein
MIVDSYIPLNDCKHGTVYRLTSRNLICGVFNEKTKGFVGLREKFDRIFLFTEFHWDTGPPFGTAKPQKELILCPIEELSENNKELFEWLDNFEGIS